MAPSPTIAGFPLMTQISDLRYYKLLLTGTQHLWVSTEIVSPWYYFSYSSQNASTIMAKPAMMFGEAGSFLSGGYGDLTYSYRQDYKLNQPAP